MKTALVAGATGAVGRALVYQLLEDNTYTKIVVIVRRAFPVKHPKLEVIETTFTQIEKLSVQADDVFCCLGTTIKIAGTKERFYQVDHEYVYTLAKVMKQLGASTFVLVSAMGASVRSSIFYNKVKGEIERDVMALGYRGCIVVRPSLLLTGRAEFRAGEAIAQFIMKYASVLFVGPLKKWRAIKVEQVAKAMRYYAALGKSGNEIIENDRLFI